MCFLCSYLCQTVVVNLIIGSEVIHIFIWCWVTYSDFYPHRTRWCRWCQWEFGPGTQCSVTSQWASPFHPLLCGGPECFPKQTHDDMRTWLTHKLHLQISDLILKNKHKSDIEAHLLPHLIWEGVSPRISYSIFLHKGLVCFFFFITQDKNSHPNIWN